jgi:hypothetical protein
LEVVVAGITPTINIYETSPDIFKWLFNKESDLVYRDRNVLVGSLKHVYLVAGVVGNDNTNECWTTMLGCVPSARRRWHSA